MENKKTEDCKGCLMYEKCDLYSQIGKGKSRINCPCQICIIKCVCTLECDEMATFRGKRFYKTIKKLIGVV